MRIGGAGGVWGLGGKPTAAGGTSRGTGVQEEVWGLGGKPKAAGGASDGQGTTTTKTRPPTPGKRRRRTACGFKHFNPGTI
jgi:hypothetical protein